MSRHGASLGLSIGCGLVLTGCSSGCSFNSHRHERPIRVRHVRVDHVCTRHCVNHYWNGSRVVVLEGHVHGPECGHVWNGTHWVLVTRRRDHHPKRVVHVCTHACHNHYWNGAKLVALKGHTHGPGCGHVWNGTHWVIKIKKASKVQKRPKTIHPRPTKAGRPVKARRGGGRG